MNTVASSPKISPSWGTSDGTCHRSDRWLAYTRGWD